MLSKIIKRAFKRKQREATRNDTATDTATGGTRQAVALAFSEGYKARCADWEMGCNPYPRGTPEYAAFIKGWKT